MGRVEQYPTGTFCWVDLRTTEWVRAREFYSGLFGWELADVGSDDAPYAMARLDGADVCGLQPAAAHEEGRWTSYVAVDDVAGVAAKAIGLGADVLGEVDVTPAGRVLAIRDPAGAVIGLWRTGDVPGARVVDEVGTWNWNELVTPDLDRAAAFYAELLGWEAQPIPNVPGRLSFRMGDLLVGGGHAPNPGEAPAPRWDVSFRVADIDASLLRVQELGGRVVLSPMDVPVGRFAIVADSGGVHLTVTQFERVVGSVAQA